MTYTYNEMKDKTIDGIKNETRDGLITMGLYFYQTHGLPIEFFKELIDKLSFAEKVNLYMNFRNGNKKLYDKQT